MLDGGDRLPEPQRDWQRTNKNYYEDVWRNQYAALDAPADRPFDEWFELNWQVSNQYWSEFLNRYATGRRLLECGGATGRLPLLLAKQGWHCTLLDLTHEGPRLARRRFTHEGQDASFVTGNVFHLPFAGETFDVVYSNGLLDVLPDITPAIREMARVIRPGGLFVAATNPRRLSVQTIARLLSLPRRAWRLARRTASRACQPTTATSLVFRNDFSLEVHLDACKSAGLRNVHGHGVGLLPVVGLPGPLMRRYTQLTRLLEPLCLRFNWSEAAWTARWGVMLAIYGFK